MKLQGVEQLELVRGFLAEGKSVKHPALGQSMLPSIPDGAVLEIQPIASKRIMLGDVVFFVSAQGAPLVHRIARRFRRGGQLYIQAWGDNNHAPDVSVPGRLVLGRVVAYEIGGKHIKLPPSLTVFLGFLFRRYGWYYLRRIVAKGRRKKLFVIRDQDSNS